MSARLGSSSVLLLLRLWPFPTAAVAAVAEVVAVTAVAETAAAVAAVVETAAAVAAVERSRLLLRDCGKYGKHRRRTIAAGMRTSSINAKLKLLLVFIYNQYFSIFT